VEARPSLALLPAQRLAFDADKTSRKVFRGAVSRAGVRLVALSVEGPLYSETKYRNEIDGEEAYEYGDDIRRVVRTGDKLCRAGLGVLGWVC
jgi:hypothetical protein